MKLFKYYLSRYAYIHLLTRDIYATLSCVGGDAFDLNSLNVAIPQEERKQVIPYPVCTEIEGETHELVPFTIRAKQPEGALDDALAAAAADDNSDNNQASAAIWQVDKNKTNSVKVLSGPSGTSHEVGTLRGFEKVTEHDMKGDWIRISSDGDTPRWVQTTQGGIRVLQRLHIGAEVQVTDVSAVYPTASILAKTLGVSSSWTSGNKPQKDDVGIIIAETIADNSDTRKVAIQLKVKNKTVLMSLNGCKLLADPTVRQF